MGRWRWCVLLVVAGFVAGCGAGPAPPAAAPLATTVEVWDEQEGWGPAPRVPDAAPTLRWSAEVPVGATSTVDATGTVVVAVPQGPTTRVDRLDAASGRVLWSVAVPGVEATPTLSGRASPVVVLEDQAPDGTVTVLNAADGRVLWQAPEDRGAIVDARPDVLLVRSFADTTAVDRATGAERWRVPDDVTARPSGLVIAGTADAATATKTHGVADPATGAPRWTQQDPLFSDLDAVGDVVVRTVDVEPGPDTVTRHDLATGTPLWTAPVDGIGRASLTPIDGETLLVSGGGGPGLGTAAVSLTDGRVLWRAPASLAGAVRLDGRPVAVSSGSRRVTVADARNGETRDVTLVGTPRVAGAALYSVERLDVVATGLGDLRERWRVPAVGDIDSLDVVPGGFVAAVGRAEPRRLVGFQG